MTEPSGEAGGGSGSPEIDAVMADLAGLDEVPVNEHLDRLTGASEALQRALDANVELPDEPEDRPA